MRNIHCNGKTLSMILGFCLFNAQSAARKTTQTTALRSDSAAELLAHAQHFTSGALNEGLKTAPVDLQADHENDALNL